MAFLFTFSSRVFVVSSPKVKWLESEVTPQSRKDYISEKFPLTPTEIETATFRLVAQWLNKLRYRVP